MAKSSEKVDPKKVSTEQSPARPVQVDVSAHRDRDPARDSALSRAVQQIEKQFGKGAVMKLDGEQRANIDGIPTGSLSLDIALGGKGVPRGRVLEVFGPESSGKTTLTLHIIANAQRAGGVAAFIDAEHALDPSWAKRLGVRLDDLLVSQPDTGERALKFYSSVRIDVRRTGSIKEGEVAVGNRTRARVVKNKVAPPFRDAEFDIMFDRGISYEGDLIDLAVLANVVDKSGAWYTYKGTRLGQGRENAKNFLFENKDLAQEIREQGL